MIPSKDGMCLCDANVKLFGSTLRYLGTKLTKEDTGFAQRKKCIYMIHLYLARNVV